jgi:hypothetical protein
VPPVVLHVDDLLHDVRDRERAKIARIRFAASVDEVALAARVETASSPLDHRRWRRGMLVRKPVDRGMAAIDLSEGECLLASGDMEERSVFPSCVRNPARVRPCREVRADEIRRRIVVGFWRSRGVGRVAHAGSEERDRARASQEYEWPNRRHDSAPF